MKLKNSCAFLWLVPFTVFIPECLASCYFPDYLQGDYITQAGVTLQSSAPVQYMQISISTEAVSTWGYCQRKIGNDLYLIENLENNAYCLRCFHISAKSPNILIVRTGGHPDRCYVSTPSAEASCPKAEFLEASRQMILYKSSQEFKKEPCPINGKYTFRYKQSKSDHAVECSERSSHIDNCPSSSELNIHFRDCPFENHEIVFECLGTWSAPNNQKYLAVFDTRQGEDPRPRYRCGLLLEDSGSGTVYVAFSSDSTCVTDLKSSQSGFETLVLNPQSNSPTLIAERTCRFPNWLQGRWELVNVNGSFFTFTDATIFKTYTFQCLNFDDSERRYDLPGSIDEERKILVHGRSHCGEEMYLCIWLKRRGPNVFEFQRSFQTSPHYNSSLCASTNFQQNAWVTQGRKDYLEESPCPVLGEYGGTLPDSENMCAKLWSDCFAPDTMYYTVSDCSTQTYEDRRRRIRQVVGETNITMPLQIEKSVDSAIVNYTRPPTISTDVPFTLTTTTKPPETTSSIGKNTSTTGLPQKLNDSLAVESIPETTRQSVESVATESSSVGSYFVENRNLPDFVLQDARYDIPAKTFLPPPIGSSTMQPPSSYRQPYQTYSGQNPYPYDGRSYMDAGRSFGQQPNYQPAVPQYRTGYYQSQEQLRNSYYQEWNRSRPNDYTIMGGQNYVADPNMFERRTVYALPPIQLPPVGPRPPTTFSRNSYNRIKQKDREYKCLGQWQENGFTYTFTQRKHVGTYECFVGSPISENEFMIREAGRHCERNINALLLGMVLTKKSSCAENRTTSTTSSYSPTTKSVPITVTTTKYTPKRVTPTTNKSWRPILNVTRPQSPYRSKNNNVNSCTNIVPSQLLIILISVFYFR